MGLTEKEFAKKSRVSQRKVKEWYDKNYLIGATKNGQRYDIPEDTPIPYKADPRINRIPTLWKAVMNAAEKQRVIFPSMYPKFQDGTVEKTINEFVESGLIKYKEVPSGGYYLEITRSGYKYKNQLTVYDYEKIYKAFTIGVSLIQAFASVASVTKGLPPAA